MTSTVSACHRLARVALAFTLALAPAACGSSPHAATPAPEPADGPRDGPHDRVVARTESQVIRTSNDYRSIETFAPGTPKAVLAALAGIYGELGIEVKLLDEVNGDVGNRAFSRYYRLAGKPMSAYADCGATPTGTVAANAYRMSLSLVSHVAPSGDGSTVVTSFRARARDMGTSGDEFQCEATSVLEDMVHTLLLKRFMN